MNYRLMTVLLTLCLSPAAQAEHPSVDQRQAIFEEIEQGTEQLEDLCDDHLWDDAATLAGTLAQRIDQLIRLFPEQSRDQGRSREIVWEEWSQFSGKLERLGQDYRDLQQQAIKGNAQSALEALDRADGSCRSCHMDYRSLW